MNLYRAFVTVTHLSTNRARPRLTSFIETNALPTTPDHHHSVLSKSHRMPLVEMFVVN